MQLFIEHGLLVDNLLGFEQYDDSLPMHRTRSVSRAPSYQRKH
jgi:hypothetical protein